MSIGTILALSVPLGMALTYKTYTNFRKYNNEEMKLGILEDVAESDYVSPRGFRTYARSLRI